MPYDKRSLSDFNDLKLGKVLKSSHNMYNYIRLLHIMWVQVVGGSSY